MQRAITDVATAAGALTTPWWLDLLHQGYSGMMAALALFIALGRAAIIVREWRGKRQ